MSAMENLAEELAKKITDIVLAKVRGEQSSFIKDKAKFCWSEKDAAQVLECSPQTLARRRKAGEIDSSANPAGKPVYMAHHLLDYLVRNEKRNGSQKVGLKDVLQNSNLVEIDEFRRAAA